MYCWDRITSPGELCHGLWIHCFATSVYLKIWYIPKLPCWSGNVIYLYLKIPKLWYIWNDAFSLDVGVAFFFSDQPTFKPTVPTALPALRAVPWAWLGPADDGGFVGVFLDSRVNFDPEKPEKCEFWPWKMILYSFIHSKCGFDIKRISILVWKLMPCSSRTSSYVTRKSVFFRIASIGQMVRHPSVEVSFTWWNQ